MAYLKICQNFESCLARERELQQIGLRQTNKALLDELYCDDCITYKMYIQGFKDGAEEALKKAGECFNNIIGNAIIRGD